MKNCIDGTRDCNLVSHMVVDQWSDVVGEDEQLKSFIYSHERWLYVVKAVNGILSNKIDEDCLEIVQQNSL